MTGNFHKLSLFFLLCTQTFFFCFIFFVVLEMSPRCLSLWFRRSWNPVDSNWRSWDYWAAVLSTRPRSSCWKNSFGTSRYIVRFRNLDRKFSKSKPLPAVGLKLLLMFISRIACNNFLTWRLMHRTNLVPNF